MDNAFRVVQTSCRGCHGVCQVLVHVNEQGKIIKATGAPESPTSRGCICCKGQDSLNPSVVHVEHAWWLPEQPGPDHGWRECCANLLFGHEQLDPDSGAEPLKSGICRIEFPGVFKSLSPGVPSESFTSKIQSLLENIYD